MFGKILIVDDDVSLTKSVESILEDANYTPVTAYTAEDGLRMALDEQPDLALLDVMVPSIGGWEACRRLRTFSDIPIVFLTALGDVDDVVRGLEMGADDYIVKPFEEQELLARVKAHLRRHTQNDSSQDLVFGEGELVIDLMARKVVVRGENVQMTPREFDLLATLASEAGRVMSINELLRRAWGMDYEQAKDNVKPYIHYLRKKIEKDSASPRWILTVRGVGYRFADN